VTHHLDRRHLYFKDEKVTVLLTVLLEYIHGVP